MNINYKKNLSSLLFEEENKDKKVMLSDLSHAPFFLVPPEEFQPLKDQLKSGVYTKVKNFLNKENSLRGNTTSTADDINSDSSLKDTAGLEKGDGLANLPYSKVFNIAKKFIVKYRSAIKSLKVEDEITRQQLMKFEVPPIPLGENFNINILNVKNEDTSSPNNTDLDVYTELGFAFFTLTMKAKEKSEEGSKNDKINVTRYLANNDNIVVFAMPVIKNFSEDQIEELKTIGLLKNVKQDKPKKKKDTKNENFIHNSSLKDLLLESGSDALLSNAAFGLPKIPEWEENKSNFLGEIIDFTQEINLDALDPKYYPNLKDYYIEKVSRNPEKPENKRRLIYLSGIMVIAKNNNILTKALEGVDYIDYIEDYFKNTRELPWNDKNDALEKIKGVISEFEFVSGQKDIFGEPASDSQEDPQSDDKKALKDLDQEVRDQEGEDDAADPGNINLDDPENTTPPTGNEPTLQISSIQPPQSDDFIDLFAGLEGSDYGEEKETIKINPIPPENSDVIEDSDDLGKLEFSDNEDINSKIGAVADLVINKISGQSTKEIVFKQREKIKADQLVVNIQNVSHNDESITYKYTAFRTKENDNEASDIIELSVNTDVFKYIVDNNMLYYQVLDNRGMPTQEEMKARAEKAREENKKNNEDEGDNKYRENVQLILNPFNKRFPSIAYDKFDFDNYKEIIDNKEKNLPKNVLEEIRFLSGRLIKDDEVVGLLLDFVEKLFIDEYKGDLVRFKEIADGDFKQIQKLIEKEFVEGIKKSNLFESYNAQGRKVINEAAILGGVAAAGLAKALGASIASCFPFLAMHLQMKYSEEIDAAVDAAKDAAVNAAKGAAGAVVGAGKLSLQAVKNLVDLAVKIGKVPARWIASTYKYLKKKYGAVTQALIKKEIQKALSKEGELIKQNKLLVGDLIAEYYSLYLKKHHDYDLDNPPAIDVKDVDFDTIAGQMEKELSRSSEEVELFTDEFMKIASSWSRGGGREEEEPEKSFMGKMFSKLKGEGVDIGSKESLSHLLFEKDIISEDVDQLSEDNLNEFEFLKRFKRNKDQDKSEDKDQDKAEDKDQDKAEDKDQVINEDREAAHALYENRIQNIVEGTFRVIGKDVYNENLASNEERQEAIRSQAAKTSQDANIGAVLGGYASIPAFFALSGISLGTLGMAPAVALGAGAAIKGLGVVRNMLRNRGQIKSEDLKRLDTEKEQFIIQLREIILRKVKDAKGIKESAIFKTNLSQFLFEADSGTFVKWESIERSLESTGLFIYNEEFVDKFEENPRKLEQIRSRFARKLASLIKEAFGTEVQGIEATTPEQAGYYTFADSYINQSAPQGQSAMPQALANALPNPPRSPSGPMNEIEQFMSLMNNSGGGLFAALMFMMIQQQFGKKAKKGQSMMDIMQMFFGSLADNQKDLPEEIAQDEQVQEAIVNKNDPQWLKSFYAKSTDTLPKITITYTESDKENVKEAIKQLSRKLDTLQANLPKEISGTNCTVDLKSKRIDNKIKDMLKDYIDVSSGEVNKITLSNDFYKEEKSTSAIDKFADYIIVGLLYKWFDLNSSKTGVLKKTNKNEIDVLNTKMRVLDAVYKTLTDEDTVDKLFQESRRVKGDLISEHRELLEMWRKL